ncbi:MAG: DUF3106 domain-containing protein [Verrucomicrobiota bacterium]|jgi:hypothetical protein
MSHLWQARCRLATVFAVGQIAVFQLAAETVTNVPAPQKLFSAPANLSPPPVPHLKSPVDLFRELLAMTPAERENYLTNRPPGIRDRILAKVREYEALDPNERELRLRATELGWYLLPLMHESPTNRAAQLAAIPDDLRALVKAHLMQWDILPSPLQQEFLESEHALRYFTHVDLPISPPMPPMPPGHGWHNSPPDPDLAHWNVLSEDQHQKITAQCNQFFELTPMEKKKTLNTLSAAERQQMEKTLETFGKLPPAQRLKCIRSFTEFAGMSAQEKQDFLKNAQRWSQMSPKERQTWRDLVTHVPEWPPLSPALMPPMPPQLTQRLHPVAVTNPD